MEDVLRTLLSYQLPKGVLDYFELVSVKQEKGKLVLQLEELNVKPLAHHDKSLESKGFLPAVRLEDFPIREHIVYLLVRRRQWVDKQTGKTVINTYALSAEGTSYTQKFGAFFKRSGWTQPRLVPVGLQNITALMGTSYRNSTKTILAALWIGSNWAMQKNGSYSKGTSVSMYV